MWFKCSPEAREKDNAFVFAIEHEPDTDSLNVTRPTSSSDEAYRQLYCSYFSDSGTQFVLIFVFFRKNMCGFLFPG